MTRRTFVFPVSAVAPIHAIAEIPEIVFVAGYPEDEYLGYYLLETGNLIDPSYEWWTVPGAVPRTTTGANYAPANVSSITGTLPAGVTYNATTSRLAYDGSGSANDRRTVTLNCGGLSRSFTVRVVVPQVIWGDSSQWGSLPAVYSGALSSVPRVARSTVPTDTNNSFAYACETYMSAGGSPDTAGIILITRGTYDSETEAAQSGNDIEWRVKGNCNYVMVLGEPTRGQAPTLVGLVGADSKVAFGAVGGTSGRNTHLKNVVMQRMYTSIQPLDTEGIDYAWTFRKTRFALQQTGQKVIGDFLNVSDTSTIASGAVRSENTSSATRPWRTFVELSVFDRCGPASGCIEAGGGYYASIILNGVKVLGSYNGQGYLVNAQCHWVKTYNCYVSYLADPATVTATQRLRGFVQMRASSELDAFNVRGFLSKHGSAGIESVQRTLFRFLKGAQDFSKRYPPYYPNVKSEAAPFTDLSFNFTSATVTSGGVPQIKHSSQSTWTDAGSAAGTVVTLPASAFTLNGTYKVRLRNAASTSFTAANKEITLHSYKNAGYWLVADNRAQGITNAEYPHSESGPFAYAPDTTFWDGLTRSDGSDPRTNKRFLASCSVEWDTRPSGATAASTPAAFVIDEGSYPISPGSSLYGRVPAAWTDLSVTFVANGNFPAFQTPWTTSNQAQGSYTLYGVGAVPSPLPTPLVVDYGGNVTASGSASSVTLPTWWGQ